MLKTKYPYFIFRTLFHSIFCGNLRRFILVFSLFTSISLFASKPVTIIVSLPPLYTPFLHEYTSEGADQLQGSKIIYVAKGDYLNATFSGISLVPMAGDVAGKGLKYTIKIIENSSSAGKNAVGILRKIPVEQLINFIKKIYSLPAAPLQRLFKDFIENPVLLEKVALNQKLVDGWKRLDDLGVDDLARRNLDNIGQSSIISKNADNISTASNARKGNFGEIGADLDLNTKGYESLQPRITDLDAPGHNGLDGIYRSPNGDYIIIEGKYTGSASLNPANPNTLLPRQMSDAWIASRNWDGINLDQNIIDNLIDTKNYQRVLAKVAPDGSVTYKLVDTDGYVVTGNAGVFNP